MSKTKREKIFESFDKANLNGKKINLNIINSFTKSYISKPSNNKIYYSPKTYNIKNNKYYTNHKIYLLSGNIFEKQKKMPETYFLILHLRYQI